MADLVFFPHLCHLIPEVRLFLRLPSGCLSDLNILEKNLASKDLRRFKWQVTEILPLVKSFFWVKVVLSQYSASVLQIGGGGKRRRFLQSPLPCFLPKIFCGSEEDQGKHRDLGEEEEARESRGGQTSLSIIGL